MIAVNKYIRRINTRKDKELFNANNYSGTKTNMFKLSMNEFKLEIRKVS